MYALALKFVVGMCQTMGGGGEEGSQNSVPSAAVEKQQSIAAIGFHGTLLPVHQFFL